MSESAHGAGWGWFDSWALADPAVLNDAQRKLLAFGWLRTEVNNGGFHQFFFNSAGDLAVAAIEAAREMEVDDLAELVTNACRILGDPYPADREARQQVIAADVDDVLVDMLEPLDAAYYELEVRLGLDSAMDGFVAGHPSEFEAV